MSNDELVVAIMLGAVDTLDLEELGWRPGNYPEHWTSINGPTERTRREALYESAVAQTADWLQARGCKVSGSGGVKPCGATYFTEIQEVGLPNGSVVPIGDALHLFNVGVLASTARPPA